MPYVSDEEWVTLALDGWGGVVDVVGGGGGWFWAGSL